MQRLNKLVDFNASFPVGSSLGGRRPPLLVQEQVRQQKTSILFQLSPPQKRYSVQEHISTAANTQHGCEKVPHTSHLQVWKNFQIKKILLQMEEKWAARGKQCKIQQMQTKKTHTSKKKKSIAIYYCKPHKQCFNIISTVIKYITKLNQLSLIITPVL